METIVAYYFGVYWLIGALFALALALDGWPQGDRPRWYRLLALAGISLAWLPSLFSLSCHRVVSALRDKVKQWLTKRRSK